MKIYIAGPITGVEGYEKRFQRIEEKLEAMGHAVMNPAKLNKGFTHEEYMIICAQMVCICEGGFFMEGWQDSKGACMEHQWMMETGKKIFLEMAQVEGAR